MKNEVWKIEVYENGTWRDYGTPSNNFARLYKMCERFAENGRKARVVKCNKEVDE